MKMNVSNDGESIKKSEQHNDKKNFLNREFIIYDYLKLCV